MRLEESIVARDCLRRIAFHRWLDQLYLHTAADLTQLQYLVPRDAEITRSLVNQRNMLDRSPLHIACLRRWKFGVLTFLFARADPDTCTVYRSTPLHFAAAEGLLDICKVLLDFIPVLRLTQDCKGQIAFECALIITL